MKLRVVSRDGQLNDLHLCGGLFFGLLLNLVNDSEGAAEVAARPDGSEVARTAQILNRIEKQGAIVANDHFAEEGVTVGDIVGEEIHVRKDRHGAIFGGLGQTCDMLSRRLVLIGLLVLRFVRWFLVALPLDFDCNAVGKAALEPTGKQVAHRYGLCAVAEFFPQTRGVHKHQLVWTADGKRIAPVRSHNEGRAFDLSARLVRVARSGNLIEDAAEQGCHLVKLGGYDAVGIEAARPQPEKTNDRLCAELRG